MMDTDHILVYRNEAPAVCGIATSAITLFRLAALLMGNVQYSHFYYDTPASMQERVRMSAAHDIMYQKNESDSNTSAEWSKNSNQ